MLKDFESGKTQISYPFAIDPTLFETLPTGHFLTGVEFADNSSTFLKSAKVLSLHYFLATKEEDEESKARFENISLRVKSVEFTSSPVYNLCFLYIGH